MNLRILVVLCIFISGLYASNFNAYKLTKQEVRMLKTIKQQGKKHGVSYSLMAIAIKESSIGKYPINVDSKDYGLYQANIKTVISREKLKNTAWNRNKVASKLITDFQYATKNAIAELVYWKKVHNNDWRKVWGSYNGGWRYDSKRARKYSKEIASIIRKLKKVKV
jgi:hypothetical protein